jgi:hypothetical protein
VKFDQLLHKSSGQTLVFGQICIKIASLTPDLGVKDARSQMNVFRRCLVSVLLRNVAADHERNENMIKQSKLDWVIVRPPILTRGERTGSYRSGVHVEPRSLFPRISRADVAQFMLKQLSDDTFLHRTPIVMY